MTGWRSRAALLAALLALAACSREPEPDDAALREALVRMHSEWSVQLRRGAPKPQDVPEFYSKLPNVNLAFDAQFALQIISARKITCQPLKLLSGHVCRVVVAASMAGRPNILQNIEARFFKNAQGWQVRDLRVVNATE